MCLTGISVAGVDRDMVFCAERFGKREANCWGYLVIALSCGQPVYGESVIVPIIQNFSGLRNVFRKYDPLNTRCGGPARRKTSEFCVRLAIS